MHGHHNGSAVVPYHNNPVLDIIDAAGMDETYGTYVDNACFAIHDYDDDTDHDTDDATDDDTDYDTTDDTDDDTDDGGPGSSRSVTGRSGSGRSSSGRSGSGQSGSGRSV